MLTIQYVFRDVYFSIKNILRKLYRSCAVFVSGVAMLALLVLNEQSFPGTGKEQIGPGLHRDGGGHRRPRGGPHRRKLKKRGTRVPLRA